MPDLKLYLLGSPRIARDGIDVQVETRKAIALVSYLAVTGIPHRRERLATLLWPETDQTRARTSLRHALATLKRAVGDGYLEADREAIALVGNETLWIDVTRFRRRLSECHTHGHARSEVCPACVEPLTAAAGLYRDDFLAGFTLRDSPTFDEWQFFETESLRREMADALERLVRLHADAGDYDQAIGYARRLVALDPLHEPAHRQLMHLYAQAGRRTLALRQYQECVRVLHDELGVAPAAETTQLYEQIQTGTRPQAKPRRAVFLATTVPAAQRPAFLESDAGYPAFESDIFVGREEQLAALETHLAAALEGQGRVVFVTGEAGHGKTALMTAFARRAQEQYSDLIVATGASTAHFGVGDPYLPFCDVLDLLTGDVEHSRAAGRLTREQASRLWIAAPHVIDAIAASGPDLIDVLISGATLVQRAANIAPHAEPWLQQVHERVAGATRRSDEGKQSQLFDQYELVLHILAARQPLLFILDDLQWADSASLGLLFHLGRRLPGRRILILVAYRPSDVTLDNMGRGHTSSDAPLHPLEPVVHELTRRFGDVRVDLDALSRTEDRQFVDALVDSQPNRFDEAFRAALFRRTQGHALFTIELLREMRARGDLVQDDEGYWRAAPTLIWDVLPARIEAVIERRIGRLDNDLQDLLRAASVEGETFTVQVLARVQETDERQVLRQVARTVARRHRLVRESGEVTIRQRRLLQCQFTHSMFQRYLYNSLSVGERRMLHREIAAALEALYADRIDDVIVKLAHHYTLADEAEHAIPYLLQAGDRARSVYAHKEAIGYYQRALGFLKEEQAYDRAARTLMKLGLTYHTAFQFNRAREAYEEGFVQWQRATTHRVADLPPAPHALRIAGNEPLTLDPTVVGEHYSTVILDQLFSGLTALGPEMDVVPDVATRWDVTEGGRRYVFHLRDDVVWSDGRPVTAGDFEFAWKRLLDPATGSPTASFLYDVKGARAFHQGQISDPDRVGVRSLDERTLAVELEAPTGHFLYLLADASTYPLPQHVVTSHGDRWTDVQHIVTNGPFRLAAWQRGESLSLRRNHTYHGQFTGNVHQVEYIVGVKWSDLLALYQTNELDLLSFEGMASFGIAEIDAARRRHAEDYISLPGLYTGFIGFDISRPPFDDRRVRRAFGLALDRERWADEVARRTVLPGTGGFVPPGIPGHSPDIGLPHDPGQARRLLAQAAHPDGAAFPPVTLVVPDTPHWVIQCAQLQQRWQAVLGVEIQCERLEISAFLDLLFQERRAQLFALSTPAFYPDPDYFLRVTVFQIQTQWRNEEYLRLVEQARRLTDQAARMTLYRQADRILVEEAVIIPIWYGRFHLLLKPWVKDYPLSPMQQWFWKDVVIEPH